jgi:hypothetical protein
VKFTASLRHLFGRADKKQIPPPPNRHITGATTGVFSASTKRRKSGHRNPSRRAPQVGHARLRMTCALLRTRSGAGDEPLFSGNWWLVRGFVWQKCCTQYRALGFVWPKRHLLRPHSQIQLIGERNSASCKQQEIYRDFFSLKLNRQNPVGMRTSLLGFHLPRSILVQDRCPHTKDLNTAPN